jgi:glycosyltransferase involved in cell wall biosynthesis
MMFSILIPTWNNLEFLKLCIESIRKHSKFNHEIVIHINDGSDGTLEWVKEQGFKYSYSEKNMGVCLSVNHLVAQASNEWIVFLNDDMYACPNWDIAFIEAINSTETDLAFFSGTLIEPRTAGNPHIIVQDYGRTPQQFDEAKLLESYMQIERPDAEGNSSQPTLIHRKWWHMVGGYSVEFGPGMSSDDDLLMKLWVVGCRNYRIVGASRFYHFACKSTGRIRRNRGGREFLMKWGITQRQFYRNYLFRLGSASIRAPGTENSYPMFPRATFAGKMKRMVYGLFSDYPLGELDAWDPLPGRHLK